MRDPASTSPASSLALEKLVRLTFLGADARRLDSERGERLTTSPRAPININARCKSPDI